MDTDIDDESSSDSLLHYFSFDETNFPFSPALLSQIHHRRAALGDVLLFDILLQLGGIRSPDSIYPPSSPEELETLLGKIQESKYDALKKDCLVYFLIKWCRDGTKEKRFLQRGGGALPPQFIMLVEAYWGLDSGVGVDKSVSLLSDSRLNQDYSSKILQAIATSDTSAEMSIHTARLIVKYISTAKPLLTEPDDLELYLVALAASGGLFEAWKFQRSFDQQDPMRERLFRKILEWCVEPTPKPTPLSHLLTIPLSSWEESILHTYATNTSSNPRDNTGSAGKAVLQTLSCTRLVQTGQYADAIKLHRKFVSTSTNAMATSAAKMVQDRTAMIQTLYEALPSVEKGLLDVEISTVVPFQSKGSSAQSVGTLPNSIKANGTAETVTDVDRSWEDLSMSSTRVNGTGNPPARQVNGLSTSAAVASLPLTSSSSTNAVVNPTTVAPTVGTLGVSVPSSFALSGSTPTNPGGGGIARSGAVRFGFGVGGLNTTTGGGAPLITNSIPILPTSVGGVNADLPLPLSSSLGFGGMPSLSSSTSAGVGKPRKSLGPFGTSTSSTGGVGMGGPGLFSSSKRKPNAFYKPPVITNPVTKLSTSEEGPNPFSLTASGGFGGDTGKGENPVPDSMYASAPRGRGSQSQSPERSGNMEVDADDPPITAVGDRGVEGGLEFSLFNEASASVGTGMASARNDHTSSSVGAPSSKNNSTEGALRTSTGKRARPPGAFIDADEDDADSDDGDENEATQTQAVRQTRTTRSSRSVHAAPTSSTKPKTQSQANRTNTKLSSGPRAKKPRHTSLSTRSLRQSVPGGMFDEDDDDEEEEEAEAQVEGEDLEEEEDIAPLAPAPTRATRTGTRKTRSSGVLSTEDLGPRRKSSRISTTGGETARKTTTRKSTAAGAAKTGRKR